MQVLDAHCHYARRPPVCTDAASTSHVDMSQPLLSVHPQPAKSADGKRWHDAGELEPIIHVHAAVHVCHPGDDVNLN
jgi:hypothetical protein